jgi:hypothetical protein
MLLATRCFFKVPATICVMAVMGWGLEAYPAASAIVNMAKPATRLL